MILHNKNIDKIKLKKEASESIKRTKIISSTMSADYFRNFYADDDIDIFESFWAIFLNQSNSTIGYAQISQGGISSCIVDFRIIAKIAIDCLASGVIVCHNHPSGNLTPSEADKKLTYKLKDGLKLLDIQLIDHIILTNDNFFSFNDEGYL